MTRYQSVRPASIGILPVIILSSLSTLQQDNIPLTNLLAPAAMGESRQVGEDKTAEGQAQNRRVVVRVLQNKGIAGLQNLR